MRMDEIAQTFSQKHKQMIIQNCSEILAVYKRNPGKVFFRGANPYTFLPTTQTKKQTAFAKFPPKHRHPNASGVSSYFHYRAMRIMKNLKMIAHRGNSMFATANRSTAAGYGMDLYIVFPVDGFHYTWHPEVADLLGVADTMGSEPADIPDNRYFDNIVMGYQSDNGIDDAINSGNEVMFSGKYYRVKLASANVGDGSADVIREVTAITDWIQSL